jgi:hypothetical protein
MSAGRKFILFEANEVPYRVIDHHVSENPQSRLAALLRASKQFETLCEDQLELDPWISWPTLHRGVIDEQHQILHLGQSLEAANREYPPIWQILADKGTSVGVMGSLHSSAAPADLSRYAFYVPDFFADRVVAHPAELEPFQAFNLAMTRRSARNVDGGVATKEALRFAIKYLAQGMSPSTVSLAVSELIGEFRRPHLKCRRRAIQPLITLDVFLHLMRKTRASFATLHTNHVAAAMHRYWAAGFPDDLSENPMPPEWRAKYAHEIAYSMRILDVMLGRLTAFVHRHSDYVLLVAGSMGQAPVSASITKGFVTITSLTKFMTRLGVPEGSWEQRFTMVPCVSVIVAENEADAFEQRLRQIAVGDSRMTQSKREKAPLSFDRTGSSFQLYVYFENYRSERIATLGDLPLPFEDLGFGFHEHQDEVACSARHTPEGILLVYDPRAPAVDRGRSRISTLDIAPALLQAFGVAAPSYMRAPDPRILDARSSGVSVRVSAYGGGVERPVTRVFPGSAAKAAAAAQPSDVP